MVKMSEQVREPDTSEETPAKRQKLDTAASGDAAANDVANVVEELPKEISDALDELDGCQREIDSLNEKVSK